MPNPLHDYLEAIEEGLKLTAQAGATILAMSGLPTNHESLGGEAIRKLYVDGNPDPKNPGAVDIAFADFAPYGPSKDAPASFIAPPVMRGTKLLGTIVVQMR